MAISYGLTYQNPSFIVAAKVTGMAGSGAMDRVRHYPCPRGALSPMRETSVSIKHHSAAGQAGAKLFQDTVDKRERASESAAPGRGELQGGEQRMVW